MSVITVAGRRNRELRAIPHHATEDIVPDRHPASGYRNVPRTTRPLEDSRVGRLVVVDHPAALLAVHAALLARTRDNVRGHALRRNRLRVRLLLGHSHSPVCQSSWRLDSDLTFAPPPDGKRRGCPRVGFRQIQSQSEFMGWVEQVSTLRIRPRRRISRAATSHSAPPAAYPCGSASERRRTGPERNSRSSCSNCPPRN
jgi:hypothetical protein